jgi:hypothetical protein
VTRHQLLRRLDKAWTEFKASYAGLPDAALLERGVTKAWSVRDIIAHVTTWEAEALKYLPGILEGQRPPRYTAMYGGIDAFNAQVSAEKAGLSLAEVLRQQEQTHQRVVELVERAPEDQVTRETRFRRRLRLDTYGHYPGHTRAILRWREQRGMPAGPGGLPFGTARPTS